MKKFTLILGAAAVAMAANAQYTVDPSTSVVEAQNPKTVEYITLSDGAVAGLTKVGAKCTYIGPDPDNGRNLWYWNGFNAGDDSYPRVDMEEGGYVAVEVNGEEGWSGAGFSCSTDTDKSGINTTMFNNNTHFHIAYMSPSDNAPSSIAIILCDDSETGSNPAKFALGTAFVDGAATYPTVGPKAGDDWQGIDITFADLKKLYPSFNPSTVTNFGGNIMSFLGGAVAGTTFAFDAIYFYNTDEAGVADAAVDNDVDFVVSDNTINVMGGNGIEVYNMAGQLVKSTTGTTVGTSNLKGGVYVARSGNKVQKVVVR